MPRGKIDILKANTHIIILRTTVGDTYRIVIPKTIQNLLEPNDKVKVTIEKETR